MHQPQRSGVHRAHRRLAPLALAAAASVAAQDDATATRVGTAAVVHTSVGQGIGYGVDAERPRERVVAQAAPARGTAPPARGGVAPRRSSWLPYTHSGYAGVNVGTSAFDADCGAGGFSCKANRPSLHAYTGGMFNDFLGLELGYRYLGRAERGGGRTEAQGLGLAMVGRLPAGPLHVFAKAGLAYTQSRVSASPASLLPTGSSRGWAGTYGAGAGWDLTPSSALVLEWTSLELPFAGAGKQSVENTSIGFVHHF